MCFFKLDNKYKNMSINLFLIDINDQTLLKILKTFKLAEEL